MTKVEQALKTFPTLDPEQQETIADFIMDAALPVIEFDDEEIAKINAGVAAGDKGEFASEADVQEVFARYR